MSPHLPFSDLAPNQKLVIIKIVRAHCQLTGLYATASRQGIGLDACEEQVIKDLEAGTKKILWNGRHKFSIVERRSECSLKDS